MQFQDEHVFWQGSGQWAFLKRAQGFLGRAESKTVSVDISCYLACSHGYTSAADGPGTRAGWRRSKYRGKVGFILDVGYSTHSKNLFSTGFDVRICF